MIICDLCKNKTAGYKVRIINYKFFGTDDIKMEICKDCFKKLRDSLKDKTIKSHGGYKHGNN